MFKRSIEIKNISKLKKMIKTEHNFKIKFKLNALIRAANGESIPKLSEEMGITKKAVYEWINLWNEQEIEGLKDLKRPGRPSVLNSDKLLKLSQILKEKAFFTTKDVKKIIFEEFGINLSLSWIAKLLRNKLNLTLSKPYILDKRKPENAQEILYRRIEKELENLKNEGYSLKNLAIGFLDEASHQNRANTVRLWHFKNSNKVKKDLTKVHCSSIGFYAIHGNSVSKIIYSSKKEELAKFLKDIAVANEAFKITVVIIDNFKSHHSKYFTDEAKRQGIHLIFLPPYSPDLNPIEFIWKDLKRIISSNNLSIDEIKKVITIYFLDLAKSMSYAKAWLEKFKAIFLTFNGLLN
jgi:transposase